MENLPKARCDKCQTYYFGWYLERKDVVHRCDCGEVLCRLTKDKTKRLKETNYKVCGGCHV